MKKLKLFVLIVFILCSVSYSQTYELAWSKCYGGSNKDNAIGIIETAEGDFLIVGNSNSTDGNVTGNLGGYDIWIVKINSSGDTIWTKNIGGSDADMALSFNKTNDGNFIISGYTYSNDGYVHGNHGDMDGWLVKLNSDGDTLWTRCYGGTSGDDISNVMETSDSGFILTAGTLSQDGDAGTNYGDVYWIIKIDSSGDIVWSKCYGGSSTDAASETIETTGNEYLVAGYTHSSYHDVHGHHGGSDIWLIKLDSNGDTLWTNCYGGSNNEYAYEIKQVSDNEYFIVGSTESNDGDVHGNNGDFDFWILKINSSGDTLWTRCYGGSNGDWAHEILNTSNGTFILSGTTESTDGEVHGNHIDFFTRKDIWIVQIDSNGDTLSTKCFGGTDDDFINTLKETSDDSFIVAGSSKSDDGDVTGHSMSILSDYWIYKFNITTSTGVNSNIIIKESGKVYPIPTTGIINIDHSNLKCIEIYNNLGEPVLRSNEHGIDISTYNHGIYYIKIIGNDNVISIKKVIKCR